MCQHFTVKVVSIQADNKRQSSMKTKLLFHSVFRGAGGNFFIFQIYYCSVQSFLTFIFWLTGNSLALRINDKSVYSTALKEVIFPSPYHDILKASLIIIKTQRDSHHLGHQRVFFYIHSLKRFIYKQNITLQSEVNAKNQPAKTFSLD